MSTLKNDIMRRALEQIGRADANTNPVSLARIAREALTEAADKIEYHITARTWYGRNGGEFKAELREVASGNIVFEVNGTTWGSNAWAYAMRDAMNDRPAMFPAPGSMNPTMYFRDVAKVEYEHAEVSRKRDL